LGAYRIPLETGLLIPSDKRAHRNVVQKHLRNRLRDSKWAYRVNNTSLGKPADLAGVSSADSFVVSRAEARAIWEREFR
jgi:hypothetical protein